MSICLEIFVRTGQKNVQTGWNSRKKGNCVSHASRQERSEKHLFWMLGERKCKFQWTSISFHRYIHSNLWGRASRHGDAAPSFLRPLIDLIFLLGILYNLWNKHEFHTLFIHVTAIAPGPIWHATLNDSGPSTMSYPGNRFVISRFHSCASSLEQV